MAYDDAVNKRGREICRKYDDGKRDRNIFDQRVDLLAPYTDPTRLGVLRTVSTGQPLMGQVYDNEGIFAADLATKFIGGHIHSPGSVWFSLVEEREELNKEDEVREWLEECRDRMLKDLGSSNFYGECYESDKDWLNMGIGDLSLEENPVEPYTQETGYRGARFTATKVGRFVVFENGQHQIDARYGEFAVDAFAARDMFGNTVEQIPAVKAAIDTNDYVKKFKFIHAVYPRKQEEATNGKTANQKMPWASCYVEYGSKTIVKESGYEEFPDFIPRWSCVPGEVYGRGLGEMALNTCLTASATTRMKLENLALKIKPPMLQAHGSVIGRQRLIPGAPLVVRKAGAGSVADLLQPLNVGGDFQSAMFEIEDLRKSIRRTFMVDQFQQLMEMEKQQEMRVFVFAQKLNLTFKVAGPMFGRWQSEFGVPYIRRHFNMMMRRGAFSPPPDELIQQGGRIKVQFESPLARAQRMEEIQAMQAALQDILPIAEAQAKFQGNPDVLDVYDFDKFAKTLNERYGVPAIATRSDKEIAAIRQQRAQQQAAQQANAELAQAAQGMGQMAPAIKAAGGGVGPIVQGQSAA